MNRLFVLIQCNCMDRPGRAEVEAVDSDPFTQQLLLMWYPLFDVQKVKWCLLQVRNCHPNRRRLTPSVEKVYLSPLPLKKAGTRD